MVRGVADRAFLPAKGLLEEVGDMMILTVKTIVSAVRPPYPYGGEFVSQFLFALKLCWFPLVVSTIALGYPAPGLQAANFLVLFGALDRLGGFFVLASTREFAPFVTAIVLAGVAGTAITADLGARKIREELDALQVLGVDLVKNLVVPRFGPARRGERTPRRAAGPGRGGERGAGVPLAPSWHAARGAGGGRTGVAGRVPPARARLGPAGAGRAGDGLVRARAVSPCACR